MAGRRPGKWRVQGTHRLAGTRLRAVIGHHRSGRLPLFGFFVVLDRVEGAGGKILMPKTAIGMDAGYFAMISDTDGNTVGLHSQG